MGKKYFLVCNLKCKGCPNIQKCLDIGEFLEKSKNIETINVWNAKNPNSEKIIKMTKKFKCVWYKYFILKNDWTKSEKVQKLSEKSPKCKSVI